MTIVVIDFSLVFSEVALYVVQINIKSNDVSMYSSFEAAFLDPARRTTTDTRDQTPSQPSSIQVPGRHTGYFNAECSSFGFAPAIEADEVGITHIHASIGKRRSGVEQHSFIVCAQRVVKRLRIIVEGAGQQT